MPDSRDRFALTQRKGLVMAETLYLDDGTMEIIISDGDFPLLLRDRLGRQVEDYFYGIVEQFELDIDGYIDILCKIKNILTGKEFGTDGERIAEAVRLIERQEFERLTGFVYRS